MPTTTQTIDAPHAGAARPDRGWRALFPYSPNYLEVGGHRLHYIDEGIGEPLLMVHGNPTWSFHFRALIEAFSDKHRCLAPDHLGMGLSEKPQDFDYCLDRHIDNLAALIEQLDLQNITLIVHDWGGAIGMGAAIRWRQRIRRLVLFNTALFPPPYIPKRIRCLHCPVLGTVAIRGLNAFCRAATSMTTCRSTKLDEAVRQGYLAPYDDWANRVGVDRFVKDIPVRPRHRTWQTLATLESELIQFKSFPVCIVWGMRDWCFRPECLERLVTMLPDAQVTRIPDAGHYVLEDAPTESIDALRAFFQRTPLEA